LVAAYGLRAKPRWPTAVQLRTATAAVGRSFFQIGHKTVTRRRADSALDCGAFGKGIALDRALRAACAKGATRAWFDFGGQVLHGGTAATATKLTIADPDDRARIFRTITLPAGHSAATSGNGERRHAVDGRVIGHLLDPRTGRPAYDFGSVTVIAGSAALADAAATALFVLGPERGAAVAAQLEIEAIFAVRHPK
jgi:thiamine biosynthesis lipoprotein